MKVSEWLALSSESTEDWAYEGDPDVEFRGFQLPGLKKADGSSFFDRKRFYLLVDKTWGLYHFRLSPQYRKPIDEVFELISRLKVNNILAPMELRGSRFLRGKNVIYASDTKKFAVNAGMRALKVAQETGVPVVGVTGAAGKSTLTSLVAHGFRRVRPGSSVLHPPPNFNIYDRLVPELSQLWEADFGVLEMSNVVCGQAHKLKRPLSPDVAVVTNISAAHLERFGSVEEVAKVKSHIFDSPREGATAVINPETQCSDILVGRAQSEGWKVVLYGESADASYRLLGYSEQNQKVQAVTPRGEVEYTLGAPGKHMAYNSLATLATMEALGMGSPPSLLESFASFEALPGRGKESALAVEGGTVWTIDEAYNANPESMGHFIRTFGARRNQGERRRKIIVLADMLELGMDEKQLHRDLSVVLNPSQFDRVLLYGDLMGELASEFRGDEVEHIVALEDLEATLRDEVKPGDTVGFKGSHGTGLHKVLSHLTDEWRAQA